MPMGSTAYSAGSTTVTSRTVAMTRAIMVERSRCLLVGSSSRFGRSLLYICCSPMKTCLAEQVVAGQLIADQDETRSHHQDVCCVSVAEETIRSPPEAHHDQDRAERQQLSDLDADVERQQIRYQTFYR